MIINQITDLKEEDKKLLELIACFGGKIEEEVLTIIASSEEKCLTEQLDQLCRNSLLVKTPNQAKAGFSYHIVQDIVVKATYENLDSQKKSQIHFRIAKILIADQNKTLTANNPLVIAIHLLRVDREIIKQDNPGQWIHSLYQAGMMALETTAGPGEGEFLYSSYAITFAIITKYVAGAPLIEIKQYIDSFRSKEKRLEHYLTSFMFEIYISHIHLLESGAPLGPGTLGEEDIKIDEEKEMFADTLILNREMIKLQRLYLEEKMPEAYCLTEEIAPRVSRHKGFVLNVDFTFYSILTRLAFHHFAALRMAGFSVKDSAKMIKDLSWEWESAVNNLVVAGYRVDDAMSAVWDVYRDVIGAAIIMKMFSSVFTGSLFLDLARWQNLIIGGLKYAIKQSL